MHTYLKIRAFGSLSKACGGLAVGLDSVAGCDIKTRVVITSKILTLNFNATDRMAFWATASVLCTNLSSYSILYLVPLPTSLSVRLVIAKVN